MEGEKRDTSGSAMFVANDGAPSGCKSVARFAVMKLAYLKMPSSSKFPATATPSATRRDDPSHASITSPAQKLKAIESRRMMTNRGSPQHRTREKKKRDDVLGLNGRRQEIGGQENRQEVEQEGDRRKDHVLRAASPDRRSNAK